MGEKIQPPCQFCKRDLPTKWIQEWDAFLCEECFNAQQPDDKDREGSNDLMRELRLGGGTVEVGGQTYEAKEIRIVLEED